MKTFNCELCFNDAIQKKEEEILIKRGVAL